MKATLEDSSSPYYLKSFESFLQGSYANDTNVYRDSDVDVVTLGRIADKKHDCTNTPTMVILADGQDSRWHVVAHRVVKRIWRPWGTRTTIERLAVKLFH